ncbi:FHIPEP family type III secretion protein [Rhizobacter sp. LjRoot28]|uniref:FHIPEP family type III secretion protein n=1 Tax=Rhizobacter sp. LjRoot28 TaxID=3342309 RepID=UPI003ECC97B9
MSLSAYFQSASLRPEGALSRYSDLVLVAGVIAIVALMVLPLPLFVIDLLVAVNLAMGVMLLLMAIYIGSPLEFSVFPSVLLISTLFRLSLAIATTRMILLHGDAGHIIDTFGRMVAGGNLVVGLVVFLIITVVQFIVIAKGAERVAEVAARFSLDAMPGKQMSIDSDLRSGLIDKDEAKRKRRDLEAESKLHGNLDGAMKFVKGDAIAGIVIIVINLLGGLAVGVLQQGMDMGHAMTKYSVLTIGDGMVSQIPALLAAMAAGLIVTRTSDAEDKHLGDAMRKQFTAKPRVLLVAGGICALFAFVPGFPATTFGVLALVLGAGGIALTPVLRSRLGKASGPAFDAVIKRKEAAPGVMATALPAPQPAVPLLLEVPTRALGVDQGASLTRALEEVLQHFQLTLGLALPRISIHAQQADAPWRLHAFEVPIAEGEVPAEAIPDTLAHAVREALRRHTALFLGIQETSALLTRASVDYPEAVKEVLRAIPMQRLADILRRLVEEEVSVRHARDMLEALAEAGQREKDVFTLAEFARIALKRHISHRYAPHGTLRACLLLPDLEDLLRQALRTTGGVQQLAIDPAAARQIIDQLRHSVTTHGVAAIVTTVDLRRHVRKLIELDCFDVPVLSYHELMPSLKLDVADRVGAPATPLLEAA